MLTDLVIWLLLKWLKWSQPQRPALGGWLRPIPLQFGTIHLGEIVQVKTESLRDS